MGAAPLRCGVVSHISDLCWNVSDVASPAVLFRPASHQYNALRLYHAALHDAHTLARRGGLARYKIFVGGAKEGNGIAGIYCCVPIGSICSSVWPGAVSPFFLGFRPAFAWLNIPALSRPSFSTS